MRDSKVYKASAFFDSVDVEQPADATHKRERIGAANRIGAGEMSVGFERRVKAPQAWLARRGFHCCLSISCGLILGEGLKE